MSFFSDERSAELKNLFFESATELLQTLNEQGLELEKRPGDPETVRGVRRTVHTLKGDAAACGFLALSDLAHGFEDALTQEMADRAGPRLAEVVLQAADTFGEMLQAYRAGSEPAVSEHLQAAINSLVNASPAASSPTTPATSQPAFVWSEYDHLVIKEAMQRGLKVLEIIFTVDPQCQVRDAALQLATKALEEVGNILAQHPDSSALMGSASHIQAAVSTSFEPEYIIRKCRIPAVIENVTVVPFSGDDADVLGILPTSTEDRDQKAGTALDASSPQPALQENLLRVDAEKIDAVLNLVGEMIIGKSMLTQTIAEFDRRFSKDPLRTKFADALGFQARVLNDLQKSVMKIRMVPVEHLFRRFPRMVRDVAKLCEKDVRLTVSGQDTDLDKSILDALAEPMAHLVRNAIGHGIEPAAIRLAAGKPAQGNVHLNAFHQGNEIIIEVSDDGAGIDREKVVRKAVERGIVAAEEAAHFSEGEALNLIFHPGFSTADEVTSVSGRGVGLDVVKSVLDRLKGSVRIDSRIGEGTGFFLKVPLTLAIIKALMFRVTNKLYAVPLSSVLEISRVLESDVHIVDRREVIRLREEVLPLIRLNPITNSKSEARKRSFVVVIQLADRKYGLVVDRLVGEEELVIKALDDELVATELVSGASILGDGTVVLILDLPAVVSRLGRIRSLEVSA